MVSYKKKKVYIKTSISGVIGNACLAGLANFLLRPFNEMENSNESPGYSCPVYLCKNFMLDKTWLICSKPQERDKSSVKPNKVFLDTGRKGRLKAAQKIQSCLRWLSTFFLDSLV